MFHTNVFAIVHMYKNKLQQYIQYTYIYYISGFAQNLYVKMVSFREYV